MEKNRICLLYCDTDNENQCICIDLDFVPKINEKIMIKTLDNVEYNITLRVEDRILVLIDGYNHWEVFCDIVE